MNLEALGVGSAVLRECPYRAAWGSVKSSKPCPRDSKITTKTKSLHFEDFFLQLTLPPNQSTKSEAWYCTVVVQ